MSLSNGSSDDEMPPSFPAEGSHGGSIRKVTHTHTNVYLFTCGKLKEGSEQSSIAPYTAPGNC